MLDGFLRFAITPEAQAELDELNAKYGQQSVADATGNSSPDPIPTAEEAMASQVVQDWHRLSTDAIRKKKVSIPGYAAAIEHAVAAGQI